MHRRALLRRPALALVLATGFAASLVPLPAAAQVHRNFTQQTLRGRIAFTNPPAVLLNGDPARLAPGSRIHGMNNLLVMTGQLLGTKSVVDYTLDANGDIYEVWVLTPEEIAVRPWPTKPEEAAAWRFDYLAQTWTKP